MKFDHERNKCQMWKPLLMMHRKKDRQTDRQGWGGWVPLFWAVAELRQCRHNNRIIERLSLEGTLQST